MLVVTVPVFEKAVTTLIDESVSLLERFVVVADMVKELCSGTNETEASSKP